MSYLTTETVDDHTKTRAGKQFDHLHNHNNNHQSSFSLLLHTSHHHLYNDPRDVIDGHNNNHINDHHGTISSVDELNNPLFHNSQ
eukprot:UN10590